MTFVQRDYNNNAFTAKGRVAEGIAWDLLDRVFPNATKTDVRADRVYQSQDVDFIVQRGGRDYLIEVKRDDRIAQTHNLFYEFARVYLDNGEVRWRVGWSSFSRANFFMQWCEPNFYCFEYATFQRALAATLRRDARSRPFAVITDDNCITYGIPVPLALVRPLQVYRFENGSVQPSYFPAAS